ncbi:MAG: bifunctional phosphoribosylaminoimidazolecarboxamide formyltransferase/IMP cyclohydrolase [Bacillota bacterium]
MSNKTALISCWDKAGVVELARSLADSNWEIISTGGTAKHLLEAEIPVTSVEDVTGYPSLLGGRVKTLHPALHAGILARRDLPQDVEELIDAGFRSIDLVAVNLYPFEKTISAGADMNEALENIDIGGVTLLRAAAKNWPSVLVLCDPQDYPEFAGRLRNGEIGEDFRRRMAAKAFGQTARYDALITSYLAGDDDLPAERALPVQRRRLLRYGENPHQTAALYSHPDGSGFDIGDFEQLGGPDLSYNNFVDLDAAVDVVREFQRTAVCAVKHTNPCGVAVGGDVAETFYRAYLGDRVSIYGGVIACNDTVSEAMVDRIREIGLFLEVMVAPDYAPAALEKLARRKKLRVLKLGSEAWSRPESYTVGRFLRGGLMMGSGDSDTVSPQDWRVAGQHQPDEELLEDAYFAWRVCKHAKSNAIVLAKSEMTLGVGAGQMNRVSSARLALEAAGKEARGAVMASDGFLPFPDVVQLAAEAEVRLLVQPGGSIRDDEVIAAADEAGMVMMFTGRRHFKH